jgi:predicted kinase
MRGPSGSGKSHFAEKFLKDFGIPEWQIPSYICSADHFFWDQEADEYRFDISKLSEAHSVCLRKYLGMLHQQKEVIVVDNTNIRWWEFQTYVWALSLLPDKYKLAVVECQPETVSQMQICANRQQHGVEPATVAKQAIEFEELHSFKDQMPMSVDYQFYTPQNFHRAHGDR